MPYRNENRDLRIELDAQGCEVSAELIEQFEQALERLKTLVKVFPQANLHIAVVFHARSRDYHVKTTLSLPGRKLFTGERDIQIYPAFDRCLRKLEHKVKSYRARMEREPELAKQAAGNYQQILPTSAFDLATIDAAVANMDYQQFRQAMAGFEAPLRSRIGRWLQRYPRIEQQLGEGIEIDDLVEEVFLNAFERFSERSSNVPPGEWLEQLIDPSVQAILQAPDEEFANISFVRSLG